VTEPHLPVLAEQIVESLAEAAARFERPLFLDGTLGAGGHARLLLERCPGARLLGMDRDPTALALAAERLGDLAERATLVQATYDRAADAVEELGLGPISGAVLDLGISSMQVDQPGRGFSFQQDGPLDMRMDPDGETTAADLVNELPEGELADLIYQLGEERLSRRIARAIVAQRPHRTTLQLAEVVKRATPPPRSPARGKGRGRPRRIHPATRTFQALRLAVNDELGQLDRGLPALFELLAPGGRLAVISFHSLEDRRVKLFLRGLKQEGRCRVLTKKPLIADDEEVATNPRSRSAKLRIGERTA
jgi:16S rRNA (cytosine1402-N4)-methyltransferase